MKFLDHTPEAENPAERMRRRRAIQLRLQDLVTLRRLYHRNRAVALLPTVLAAPAEKEGLIRAILALEDLIAEQAANAPETPA